MTGDELGRIAAEIGIDPKFLEQAISESGTVQNTKGKFNLTEEFQRVVETELDPEDFDLITAQAKSTSTGRRSGLQQVGRTLSGQAWTGSSFAHLNVVSRNGRTKVDVKSNPLFAYLVTFHPAIFASAVTVGVMSHGSQPLLGVGIAAALLTAATLAFKFLVNRGHAAAKVMTDRIVSTIQENAEERSALNIAPTMAPSQEDEQHLTVGS